MENLRKLVGNQVDLFFTTQGGISLTQANAQKNNNTNKAEGLLANFGHDVYNVEQTLINATDTNEESLLVQKVQPVDFEALDEVALMYAANAILGHGIAKFKAFETAINSASVEEIMIQFDIPVPRLTIQPPFKGSATKIAVAKVLELDTIEQIIETCNNDVLSKLNPEHLFNALGQEAMAAVLGKQLTKKESFLKRLLSAAKEIPLPEVVTQFAVILKKKVLAYTPVEIEDFEDLQEKLYERYTAVQSQVNSFKKVLKDAIRETELEINTKYESELLEFSQAREAYNQEYKQAQAQAQTLRQKALSELATLKIRLS